MRNINRETCVALLLELRFDGQHLAWGTGFVVDSAIGPLLLTNRHNVTGRDNNTGQCLSPTAAVPNEIVVTHHSRSRLGEWVHRIEPLHDKDNVPRWIEHRQLGPRADFVALPLSQLDGVNLFQVDLAESTPILQVMPAEPVSVIGYPFGRTVEGGFPIWATGFLATEASFNHDGLPCMLVDCRTRPGQSGSPVIAYRPPHSTVAFEDGSMSIATGSRTRMLGIYSGRINKDSDIGVIWKAAALRQLVEQVGRPPTFAVGSAYGAINVTLGG